MIYTTKLTVRPYELDSYNHVNNAVYLNYLEYARMDFLHQIGFDYKGLVSQGYYTYVTHIDIHYKASAFLDDELTIESQSVKMGVASGTFHQEIKKNAGTKDEILCAIADVTWACVKNGIPTKLPKEFAVQGLKPEK